jgi:hypothetical protein
MLVLQLLRIRINKAYLKWALSEIDPLHDDVPSIVMKQARLTEQERTLLCVR